jgi:hypothetical protein
VENGLTGLGDYVGKAAVHRVNELQQQRAPISAVRAAFASFFKRTSIEPLLMQSMRQKETSEVINIKVAM